MQLIGLRVENYLAFENAEIALVPNGMTLLVGANNSGKSALLSAVDRLRAPGDAREFVRDGASLAVVEGTFLLDAGEHMRLLERGGASTDWLDSEALSKVRWRYQQAAGSQRGFELSAVEAQDGMGGFSALFTADSPPVGRGSGLMLDLGQWLQGQVPGQPFDPRQPLMMQNLGSGPVENAVDEHLLGLMSWLNEWRGRVFHFGPLRQGTSRSRPSNAAPQMGPGGENLPEALLYLSTHGDPRWSEIQTIISTLVPEIGELQTPVDGSTVSVVFRDDQGRSRNLKDLGTGVEQLLMTIYVGVTHPGSSTILLEEPETNLDPGAQRALFGYLLDWSTGRQFVVATHSPVFLDQSNSERVQVNLVHRSMGRSTVRAVGDDRSDALAGLGVRLSDVLSAQRIVLVEGESDRAVLVRWFGNRLRKAHAAVVVAGGGDRAADVEAIERWISDANALPAQTFFLRDRDELSPAQADRLMRNGKVHVLARREIENYFLDPSIIGPELRDRLDDAGIASGEWTDEAVSAAIRRIADSMVELVALKRLAYGLRDQRLLSRKDVSRIVQEGVSLARIKAEVKRVRSATTVSCVEHDWSEHLSEVRSAWDECWAEIAPGADILASLWREAGLSFDKVRDCEKLAGRSDPAPELVQALTRFGIEAG